MAEKENKFALIGFDGNGTVLLSSMLFEGIYMEACHAAEKIANEKGLQSGIAVTEEAVWELLKKSANIIQQDIDTPNM